MVFRYPNNATEERKKAIRTEGLHDWNEDLDSNIIPELKNEKNKEPWQEKAIDDINVEIRKYFHDELDLNVDGIDSEHVHIFEPNDMTAVMQGLKRRITGPIQATAFRKHIIMTSELNKPNLKKLQFTKVLIHEALHTQEFQKIADASIETGVGSLEVVSAERKGLGISGKTIPPQWRFEGIGEGLVELMSKKILHSIVSNNEEYEEELNRKFSSIDQKVGRDAAFKHFGLRTYDLEDVEVLNEGKEYKWTEVGTYFYEQSLVLFIATRLSKAKPEKYKTIDEALKLFLRGLYRGELLPLGKEIDAVFGKGTFRLLSSIPGYRGTGGGINGIAKNAQKFLNLPTEERNPEIARKYIFGSANEEDFEKYLKARNRREKQKE